MPATLPETPVTITHQPSSDVIELDPYSLTDVEKEILDQTTLGHSIGEIALDSSCGIHEIYSMQRHIAWQVGTTSTAAMTNRYIQRGILPIELDKNPAEATDDERLFMRLVASGRDFRHIGHHFNYTNREKVAFLCSHMAILLDARVDAENEEVPNLVRRGHEAGLLI